MGGLVRWVGDWFVMYGWIGRQREKVKGGGKDLSSRAEVREKVRGV